MFNLYACPPYTHTGIVTFARPKPVDEVLNDWSADVAQVLKLIERTDHLIAKERQVHAVADA